MSRIVFIMKPSYKLKGKQKIDLTQGINNL